MKKIISVLLAFVFLLTGTKAFASVTWNNNSQGPDCPTINIATVSPSGTTTGGGSPCWTGTNLQAGAGYTVSVKVYYHNTGDETAQNTRIVVTENNVSSTQKTFTAKILSNQGNLLNSGTVSVTIPSSQTLNYNSTLWYTKNSSGQLVSTTLLNGQSGSEVLTNNGLYIGNIEDTIGDPNWMSQGAVVVRFLVSNNQPQVCTINSFSANPTSITQGQSSTLNWNTTNCTSVKLNGNNVNLDGSQVVSPSYTTTYTLTASNTNSSDSDSVTVNVSQPTQMTGSIHANHQTCSIAPNQSTCAVTLIWSTINPVSTSEVTHDGSTIATGNNGSKLVNVEYGSQNYYLYNNGIELDSETVTASCTSGYSWNGSKCAPIIVSSCTINYFTATPSTITKGDSSTLSWGTSNCSYTKISAGAISQSNNYGTTGTLSVSPTQTTTFTLTAYGSNGSTTSKSVTITVKQPTPASCSIDKFFANPTSITQGQSSTLTWNTTNCDTVSLDSAEVTPDGYRIVSPTQTKTYTLRASGSNGSIVTRQATVYVDNVIDVCSIDYFYGDPSSIDDGDSSVLKWDTTGCTSVKLDGSTVATSGTKTIWPGSTTTYTLTAKNSYGDVTEKTTVHVNESNDNCRIVNFDASDTSINEGDYSTLEWDTEDCSSVKISSIGTVNDDGTKKVYPTSDKTYVLTAYNDDGSTETASVKIYVDEDSNDDDECTIDSFTASDTYVDEGDEVTLRWRTTGCDDEVYITNVGDVDEDGSEDVYPYRTTTYTLRARGNGDSDSDSIKVTVGDSYGGGTVNANVVTTVATNISQTSAQLNGLLTGSSNGNANTYFEYGTSVYLGSRTSSRTVGINNSFSDYVSGLSANTIYYFRAVSEGSNGVSYGSIEIFKTLGYTTTYVNTGTTKVIREVVNQGTTVVGAESPVVLRIENRYQMIGVGDTIDYVVFYKNISNSRLSNPMVQVYIPKGITLTNYSAGSYSENNRTLSAPINDLYPDEEGVIYLQGRVDSLDSNLAQMVTTAILIYTTPNGAQENVMAYVLNNPRLTNLLGASAFGTGLFLGMNLIGWLLLITFILLLILLVRTFYTRRDAVVSTIHHQ